jgi:hypothetical protein
LTKLESALFLTTRRSADDLLKSLNDQLQKLGLKGSTGLKVLTGKSENVSTTVEGLSPRTIYGIIIGSVLGVCTLCVVFGCVAVCLQRRFNRKNLGNTSESSNQIEPANTESSKKPEWNKGITEITIVT